MNSCNFVGRLARDPESRGGQTSVANFTIAVDGWDFKAKVKKAQFIRCVAFGKQADTVMQYTEKGTQVALSGRLEENQWEDNQGNKRSTWQIIVQDFQLLGKPQGTGRGPINPPIDDGYPEPEPDPGPGGMFG